VTRWDSVIRHWKVPPCHDATGKERVDRDVCTDLSVTARRRPASGAAHNWLVQRRGFIVAGVLLVAGVAVVGLAVGRAGSGPGNIAAVVVRIATGPGGGQVGTGIVITPSGDVLTNAHVIEGAASITARLAGTGVTYAASLAGIDPADDVAVLRLQGASRLTPAALGDSSSLAVGDRVTAVGAGRGPSDRPVETQGAITALRQTVTTADPGGGNPKTLTGLIQFSGLIGVADSGGPLVDGAGRVVGVATEGGAQVRLRQVSPDTAFAIPINSAMAVVRDIESGTPNPRVLHGQSVVLGVDVADSLSARGAEVSALEAGSPAQAAGLVPGDIIVSLGGVSVDSASALGSALQQHHPGDDVLVVWLDPSGQQHRATLRVASGT